MGTLLQDLRYAARLLVKRPGFTLVAVLTLALGIGANTAIFSVVNAVLLKPLPYPDAERLVTMQANQSLLNLTDMQAASQSFEEAGGIVQQGLDFTGGGEPVQVTAGLVTAGYFRVLGARALLGRTLSGEEDRENGERAVVLGYGLWQRLFGGDPQIVGRTIPLSGNGYTVVGVMAPEFSSPREAVDLWASLRVVNPLAGRARGVNFLRTYWRLKPGVSLEQAQAEVSAIDAALAESYPDENRQRRTVLLPLHERVVGPARSALLVMFGAVGLVLLIACANFASLLLVRGATRQREMVIRAAMGASRWRLIRQLLGESLLLSLGGGALGVVLALWGIEVLQALKPENLPRLESIRVDAAVLWFTFGVSVFTGIVFGLWPAVAASRTDLNDAMKEGARATGGAARQRFRNALVVAELGMALVLLIGAGLLVRNFWKLQSIEPGFDPAGVITMRLELPETRYAEIPAQTAYRERVLQEVAGLGLKAGMVSELPMSGRWLFHNMLIEGRAPVPMGGEPEVMSRSVAGDYFGALGIPILRGRGFNERDRAGAPLVGLVNERFVREYFPNEEPLGKRVRWARLEDPQWITIVGVVGDVKHFGLDGEEQPAVYTPYAQSLQAWKRWTVLVARVEGDPAAVIGAIKERVWKADPHLPITQLRTMSEVMSESLSERRFNLALLVVFATVALGLATVGIYGVVSYAVAQRTHEIGIRMALGARRADVLGMVVRQGMALILAGLAVGLLGAVALTRYLESLLFEISPTDPLTFAVISGLLVFVGLLACYVPARRATRVDPMEALRYE